MERHGTAIGSDIELFLATPYCHLPSDHVLAAGALHHMHHNAPWPFLIMWSMTWRFGPCPCWHSEPVYLLGINFGHGFFCRSASSAVHHRLPELLNRALAVFGRAVLLNVCKSLPDI